MLFFIELRHAPERCPGVAPEIRDRMLRMSQTREQVLASHGCQWVGGWVSPTPHLTFITLDAPGAHAVDSALRDLGLAVWNSTTIHPVVDFDDAVTWPWQTSRRTEATEQQEKGDEGCSPPLMVCPGTGAPRGKPAAASTSCPRAERRRGGRRGRSLQR